MFYSTEVLSLKSNSKLGLVWLAATVGPRAGSRRMHRRELMAVDIRETCKYLQNPPEPLSLRLSANMMVGVTRVYGQQYQYQFSDVQALCHRLTQIDAPHSDDLDLPKPTEKNNITVKKIECISAVNADLKLPDFDINELLSVDAKFPLPSIASTPEQGRKSSFAFSTSGSSATPSGLAPFSDALDDLDTLDTASNISRIESFLRPSSSVSSLNFPANTPEIIRPRRVINRQRRFLNLFDDKIMLEKDELFLSGENHQPETKMGARAAEEEALRLLCNPNEMLPDFFTIVLHERFAPLVNEPDIEAFRTEALGSDMDMDMAMPWQSDSSEFGNDFDRRFSLLSSPHNSPALTSPAGTSPFSTPSPKLPSKDLAGFTHSKNNLDFLLFLQEQMEGRRSIRFGQLIQPPKRAVAARAFHQLLELQMQNLITCKQTRPYQSIEIFLK